MYYKKNIIVRGESFDIDSEIVEGLSLVVTPRKCRANNTRLNINMNVTSWYASTRGSHVILNLRRTRQDHIQFLIDDRLTIQALYSIDNPLITPRLKSWIKESMSYLDLEGTTLQDLLTRLDK